MQIINRSLTILAALLLPAFALADCQTREASAKENDFSKSTFAAMQATLPAAPAKWTQKVWPAGSPVGMCKGDAEGDFEIKLHAEYTYHPTKEEGVELHKQRRALELELDAAKQLPKDVAAERQVWIDKMSAANKASNAAYKAGDKTLGKQKDSEADEASTKSKAIRDKYLESVKPQLATIQEKLEQMSDGDVSISVDMSVNARDMKVADTKRSTDFLSGKNPTPKKPGLKAHNIHLVLFGLNDKRAEIYALFDKDKVAKIAP